MSKKTQLDVSVICYPLAEYDDSSIY